eukprot:278325_1
MLPRIQIYAFARQSYPEYTRTRIPSQTPVGMPPVRKNLPNSNRLASTPPIGPQPRSAVYVHAMRKNIHHQSGMEAPRNHSQTTSIPLPGVFQTSENRTQR